VGDYPGATECAISRLIAAIQHLSIPSIPKYQVETATRKETSQ